MSVYIESLCEENIDVEDLEAEADMRGAIPEYSRTQVDTAGAILISDDIFLGDKYDQALVIINNWRACHDLPLRSISWSLRRNCKKFDPTRLVAQRIKRLPSIDAKLRRFPAMKLCQMQDIGGCRAVLKNGQIVKQLMEFYKSSKTKNTLIKVYDYIESPKESGYRGVHLVYGYNSVKYQAYNKLKIEIQLRSKLQHAWATAVETVGTFIRQALKSSQGEAAWLRFFALMGTAIAQRERNNPVPGTPINKDELIKEIRNYKESLQVVSALTAFGAAVKVLTEPSEKEKSKYYLLHLDAIDKNVSITGFKTNDLEQASRAYLELERSIAGRSGSEAVLVSVDSLQALKIAYPNYFLDTKLFIEAVNKAVS